ncbi:hypothetical protein SAMN06265348_11320 [Pedobacter westerhofensis]|uniref:Uncharacterized protein n=1 Tax=Pedobacter westerhofensis TaxID=425512 RepID=A0A521FJP3_9SPHI|nr:hypothetical protein SAMN06265348_11320 [Pedobacter westerhofensis]
MLKSNFLEINCVRTRKFNILANRMLQIQDLQQIRTSKT